MDDSELSKITAAIGAEIAKQTPKEPESPFKANVVIWGLVAGLAVFLSNDKLNSIEEQIASNFSISVSRIEENERQISEITSNLGRIAMMQEGDVRELDRRSGRFVALEEFQDRAELRLQDIETRLNALDGRQRRMRTTRIAW